MTIEEAGRQLPIDLDTLRYYEEQELLKLENPSQEETEQELKDIQTIDSLARIGVSLEELKRLKELLNRGTGTKDEQIRLLKKCRFRILDDIHAKQQSLDRIDYIIYTMKQDKITEIPEGGEW